MSVKYRVQIIEYSVYYREKAKGVLSMEYRVYSIEYIIGKQLNEYRVQSILQENS